VGFRLRRGASVSVEVRRIVLRQLEVAISELHTVGDPESDEAVHDARRRVKKIRAIIRLVRPVLDRTYRVVDHDLREVSKMLAPVADGQGVIETLDAIATRYHKALPEPRLRIAFCRHFPDGQPSGRPSGSASVGSHRSDTTEPAPGTSGNGGGGSRTRAGCSKRPPIRCTTNGGA